MRIGILGAGNIGGNIARLSARAGHEVQIGFSRNPHTLAELADQIGATVGTPAQVAGESDVIVLSVPWGTVDDALDAAGGPAALRGRLVIDTTNQFELRDGELAVIDLGAASAAEHNAGKAPEARWAKAFNTLTAGFQSDSAGRTGPDRVVMFYATNSDDDAKIVAQIIDDTGFTPVRTGNLHRVEVGHQEPKGDLYGEEFHHDEAVALVERLRGTPPSGRGRP